MFERDALGRVTREEQRLGGFRFAVAYRYDAAGRAVERRYSTGWGVTIARRAEDAAPTSIDVDIASSCVARLNDVYVHKGQYVETKGTP